MLLLFWNQTLTIGTPSNIRWYHSSGYPPRCVVGAERGFSVINPYYSSDLELECVYALLNKKCTSTDVYDNNIVVGTATDGLLKTDWDYIKNITCNPDSPVDISLEVDSFTTFSGLLSDEIIALEANGDYLAVLTSTGLCLGKSGNEFYISYLTSSGADCFVKNNGCTYLAEGNRILVKENPEDFYSWDNEYNLPYNINDLWVSSNESKDTLFVATENGAYIIKDNNIYDFTPVISGSKDILSIAVDYDAHYNWGHFFTISSDTLNIINLKNKSLEKTISYNENVLFAVETQRLYSK